MPVEKQLENCDGTAFPENISSQNSAAIHNGNDHESPRPMALAAIMTALYLAMFLIALDRTIIATAIPRITDDFNSLTDGLVIRFEWVEGQHYLEDRQTQERR